MARGLRWRAHHQCPLEALGFEFDVLNDGGAQGAGADEAQGHENIITDDLRRIASSRARSRCIDHSVDERAAYHRVSAASNQLAQRAKPQLTHPDRFEVRMTSSSDFLWRGNSDRQPVRLARNCPDSGFLVR